MAISSLEVVLNLLHSSCLVFCELKVGIAGRKSGSILSMLSSFTHGQLPSERDLPECSSSSCLSAVFCDFANIIVDFSSPIAPLAKATLWMVCIPLAINERFAAE